MRANADYPPEEFEHYPIAEEEVWLLTLEPQSTQAILGEVMLERNGWRIWKEFKFKLIQH